MAPSFYRSRQLPAGSTWFDPLAFAPSGAPVLILRGRADKTGEILGSSDLQVWSRLAIVTNQSGAVIFTNTAPSPALQFYGARQLDCVGLRLASGISRSVWSAPLRGALKKAAGSEVSFCTIA